MSARNARPAAQGRTAGVARKLLRALAPSWPLMLCSLACAAATTALTLYLPVLIGQATDCIVGAGQVDFDSLRGILVRMGATIALTALTQWLMNLSNNQLVYGVSRALRNRAFANLEQLPLATIDAQAQGDTVSRMVADVDQFTDGLLMVFTQFFTGVMTIAGTLVLMFATNAGVAAAVVVMTPLSFVVARFIARRTFSFFRLQSETRGEITALINEMVGNERVVQAFSREAAAQASFDEINGRLQDTSLKATFFSSLVNPCTRCVNSLVYAAVAVIGALAAIGGGITVGGLTAMLAYANQYTKPFNEISGVVTELQNSLACAARVFELIEERPQDPDPADAVVLDRPAGHVRLDRVAFSYRPDQELIRDLTLDVAPGQRIAIVGPTGCGKTTLINLLMRFYEVNDGAIYVDEVDTRRMTRSSLRGSFGMVLQDTWLKSGTVRENIAFARPDATLDEVRSAARAACADAFISRLPQGYDTLVAENGENFSAGQRQLLCIARVMLALPPMLILDEATSSIDTRTELLIQRAFNAMMEGRTSFVVAHRLSTVQTADVILVMRDGRIVEQGSHDELLERGGFYAELFRAQFAQ